MRTRVIPIIVIATLIIGSSATAFDTSPEDDETGFPVDGDIIIEFDEPMDTGIVDVVISPDPTYPVQRTWSNNNRILTIRPTADLLPHRIYTVHVNGQDVFGHLVNEVFSFETEYYSEEDRRPAISNIIISIFIILVIVTVIAVYFTLKGIQRQKGQ